MRKVPEPLYQQVLVLALAMFKAVEADDAPARPGAYRRLRTLHRSRLGNPDPFLTETLADFTNGPRTRVKLYRLAIQQCAAFPDEEVASKQEALDEMLAESRKRSRLVRRTHRRFLTRFGPS